jgi:hypothetical protein
LSRALGAAVTALLVVACSGASGDPRPTATLLPPEISPALRVIGEGTVALDVAAGERQFIEPLRLAEAFGTPPDCASLAFIFRWRVHGDEELRFEGQLRGATVAIESGNTGVASVGCMVVEAVNDGEGRVTGDLRYYVATVR